ncbi:MAG: type 1 glutamine amidotransferase [Candidatus Omnitrophica bacterium]|nr:type 1 glutamine amidotransferase [Candidatus Omnitrophota bacterium]
MIIFIQHLGLEGPGTFGKFLESTKWDTRILDISQPKQFLEFKDGSLIKNISQIEGVVVFGGPMNVYQKREFPFLEVEEEFLRYLIREEIPVLGICLGAQLIAKALGAKVTRCENKEIGWSKVSLTEEAQADRLFRGLDERLDVFQWHEDTFELPKEAKLLAEGRACRNQAVRFSPCAWGVQFHPEMNLEMLKGWCQHYSADIDRTKLLFDYFNCQEKYIYQAKMLYLNFSRIISERKANLVV